MSNLEFAVGRQVVCISDFTGYLNLGPYPIKGCVYTIRHIRVIAGITGLLLNEISRPPLLGFQTPNCEPDFDSIRFRPVRETSIDCFTKLLEKQPELVGGDA